MWNLIRHLPPESALVRAEEPAAVWTVGEHLLATASNWLGELTYVTTLVNTEEKSRKQVTRPDPIIRPGQPKPERHRHRGSRPRVGPPISPASLGGVLIETTAEEVT